MRLLIAAICVLSSAACAQWTTNLNVNTAIADLANDQAVPKLSARADGGCYVGWFDHRGSNYDVYLQRLDQNGYEVWQHNGILVSGNTQATSLVDWDMITTVNGHALLVFTDLRAGGDLDVYAYLIDENGTSLWGPNGITLSNDLEYEANPVAAELTDGTFAIAWNRSITGSNSRLVYQKVDILGQTLLGGVGIEIQGGPGDDPGFVGVVPAPNAGFILSWVRDTVPITGAPRHIWSQRYDANGVALWGASPVVVYDAAPVPIAYKPEMQADGNGGAWFAWYSSVGAFFEGRVQHLNAAGGEVFAHNGVEISTEPSRSELYPSFAQYAGDVIVFYNKRNSSQSNWGIGGQRVSSTGALLWGTSGLEFVPYDATSEEAPRAVPAPNGAMFFVEQGNFGTTLIGARIDGNGVAAWTPSPHPACSLSSGKDKLRAVAASDGTAILVWSDQRVDANNIYAQNVELDGSWGVPPALVTPYGCGWNPAGSLALTSGSPALNQSFSLGVTDPGGSMPVGSISLLAISFLPTAPYPCGFLVGNAGMAAPGALGELLVDLGPLIIPILTGNTWAGVGTYAQFPFSVPYFPPAVGVTVYMQGALYHAPTARVGLANGLAVRFGP